MGPAIPGRIPWSAVWSWALAHEMAPDDAEDLDALIQEMDEEFRQWWRAQQDAADKQ